MRITMGIVLFFFLTTQVESAEPISALFSAQMVLVEVHLLAPQAGITPSSVRKIVTERMEELKYTVETDKDSSHDVVVQVNCGQMETKGPPCDIHYRFQGTLMPSRQVESFIYSE